MITATTYYAVYLCGATDCFLTAVFTDRAEAAKYLREAHKNPEGGFIRYWRRKEDMDFSDTGFYFGTTQDR